MALIDKLTAIADAIRGKTGDTDPLTLAQMAAEIDGLGQGEGGGLAFDMGEFVLDADVRSLGAGNGIPHYLGQTPDFVLIWTDDFSYLTEDNLSPYSTATSVGYSWLNGLTGLQQRLSSSAYTDYGVFVGYWLMADNYRVTASSPSSAAYCLTAEQVPNAEKFGLSVVTGNSYWRAGVTYKYFVSEAWWNVGGAASAE